MALHHAAHGEIVDVRPLGKKLKQAISATLVKTDHLQVFRYILPRGEEFGADPIQDRLDPQSLQYPARIHCRKASDHSPLGSTICLHAGTAI